MGCDLSALQADLNANDRDVLATVARLEVVSDSVAPFEVHNQISQERGEIKRQTTYKTCERLWDRYACLERHETESDYRCVDYTVSDRGYAVLNRIADQYRQVAHVVPDAEESSATAESGGESEQDDGTVITDGGVDFSPRTAARTRGVAADMRQVLDEDGDGGGELTVSQLAIRVDAGEQIVDRAVDFKPQWFERTTIEVEGTTGAATAQASGVRLTDQGQEADVEWGGDVI